MKVVCRASGKEFEVTEDDLVFYEKMGVPPPTLCPEERQRRRTAFRNFRNLYHRSCDGTGKKIISMYDSDAPFPVFEPAHWWSDAWDAREYGRDFDFRRPFFEQYADLLAVVPRLSLSQVSSENCAYTNITRSSRDCYMVFGCVENEHCVYGHIVWYSERCIDNLYLYRCQWCSNSIDLVDCYDVHYSSECVGCVESYFLHDCRNCRNCFGCFNLRSKEYCWKNEQLTRAEYEHRLAESFPRNAEIITAWKAWLGEQRNNNAVYPPAFGSKSEDCSGNHLVECKSAINSFDLKKCENCNYCYTGDSSEWCHDLSFVGSSTRFAIECLTVGGENIRCCHYCINCSDSDYSQFCHSSQDLFGCNGLRNAKNCILNKQYSPSDYLALKTKIIEHMKQTGEWGEFFPMTLSSFAYNESIAQEYQPLTRVEVGQRGLRWKDFGETENTTANKLYPPQTIDQAGDDVVKNIYNCEKTGKPFKISQAELEFYRRVKLPLPRLCPDIRHLERMELRGERALWQSTCAKCETAILSAIHPAAGKRILCDPCYLNSLF